MNNKFNKLGNFIKKQKVYLIGFVCLCVVGTGTFIAFRNLNASKQIESQKEELTINSNDKENLKDKNKDGEESSVNKDNAEQVKKDNESSKTVSNSEKVNFINPIDKGNVVRGFSDKPVYNETLDSWVVAKGVAISAKKGTPIVASADGKVVEVGKGDGYLGNYVKLAHANGLYTIYSNLASEDLVKKDKVVKANEKIGKVGESASNFKFEKYGEHLNLQVVRKSKDGKVVEQVNPTKYINFNSSKSSK